MRQVRKLKKLAQLRKGLELPCSSGFRVPKSNVVDEEAQQELNRTSREEMLSKLVEKEKLLKESLNFAGRKTGDLTDSGCRNISTKMSQIFTNISMFVKGMRQRCM